MTSLEIPLMGIKAGPSFKAGRLGNDSLLPIILVQCHLYSDFLGGPGVETSAIFLLATRSNMSKTHTLPNRKESVMSTPMACNMALAD